MFPASLALSDPVPEPTPILLVATTNYGVLAAVRALRSAGYAPWVAVHEPGTYAAYSRAAAGVISVPDPNFEAEGFVRELTTAAMQLSTPVVLPSGETHLLTLAKHEVTIPGVAFGVPSYEVVERATDKGLLNQIAATVGLQTPPTERIKRGDTQAASAYGFPALLKPLRSEMASSNRHTANTHYLVHHISNKQEANAAFKLFPTSEVLIQPYIPGELSSVAGVSWKGKLVCALHQLSSRIWPAQAGVSSYAATIPPDAELEQGVSRLLQEIGWSGLFQAQFIRASRGERYLIDFNPRIYGSLALAIAADLNLPAIWVDLLLGRQPDVGGYRTGVRFRQEEKDIRALIQMLVGGNRLGALRGFVPHKYTTHAIFSLRDPMPLLISARKAIRWLWHR